MSKVLVVGLVGNSVFLEVDKFHEGGETLEANGMHRELGGKGFNQAVAAARFGAEVTFVSAVGNDGSRKVIEKFLKAEKVKPLLIEKKGETAFAAIITDKKGANRVTEFIGEEMNVSDVAKFNAEIKKADIILLSNEVPNEVNEEIANIAEKYNKKIILNPAPYRKLKKAFLSKMYLLTPNEFEAKDLENFDNVIQTLGKKGSLIKKTNTLIKGTDDKPVDTTGAGDTFNGVLAAMLSKGEPIESAVLTATKASGKSVTKKGAVSSIPYQKDIKD